MIGKSKASDQKYRDVYPMKGVFYFPAPLFHHNYILNLTALAEFPYIILEKAFNLNAILGK